MPHPHPLSARNDVDTLVFPGAPCCAETIRLRTSVQRNLFLGGGRGAGDWLGITRGRLYNLMFPKPKCGFGL